jgi:hypothetical protein
MIQVSLVKPQDVDAVWPKVEKYLLGAAEYTYGRFTVIDIYKSIVVNKNSLWIAFEDNHVLGAVVTNIVAYPRKKMLCMQFCGGENLELWRSPMLTLLRKSAKDNGCDGLESSARPGWAKIFKDDGYSQCWVTFELPL